MTPEESAKLAELETRSQEQAIEIQALRTQLVKLFDLVGQGSNLHGISIAAIAKIAEHVGLDKVPAVQG